MANGMTALDAEAAERNHRLKLLYMAIDEGMVELDGDLKARIEAVKQERDVARAATDRMAGEGRIGSLTFDNSDVRHRQAYLRSVMCGSRRKTGR